MFDLNAIVFPKAILWAGYIYLGLLFLAVLRNLLDAERAWSHFFSDDLLGNRHLSRYVLFFGSLALAIKFLLGVLSASSKDFDGFMAEMEAVNQIIHGFNLDEAVGASGVAYLLSKVTNGQILTLFGKRGS